MKDNLPVRRAPTCRLCNSTDYKLIREIRHKPPRENDFGIAVDQYQRTIFQCHHCSVYFNVHGFIEDSFYKSQYNASVYAHRLLEKYQEIMALPEEKSDNRQRVRRIIDFCERHELKPPSTSVLDVGSGLCVFLGAMKEAQFTGTALDPDPKAIEHAIRNVGLNNGHAGTLHDYKTDQKFNLITFNKVLEHVPYPIENLARSRDFLTDGGFVYVELPDGENALMKGNAFDREEFFIEHYTAFNEKSFEYLMHNAGFQVLEVEAIHEPSDKYTLYGFLKA
jgi:SAM-dependent methyltransferase